jgi:3-methyl-2-oxobutanoate hydroxymethyltransferase
LSHAQAVRTGGTERETGVVGIMNGEKPVTTARLRRMKREKEPIAVITAYDYPSARHAEAAGADVLLVGDSLGNVVLGYDSTVPVTLDDMVHHAKAVARGAKRSFVVVDMPFLTYHGSLDKTLANAARLMQEGMAKAVKLEGGGEIAGTVRALVSAGVPVMGHIGLTPQSIHQLGGYFVQGKTDAKAEKLLEDAKRLEEAGAFALVLELVPEEVAARITGALDIPTIGIGAGRHCDGQVLVFHDMLNIGHPAPKTFAKTYADVGGTIEAAIAEYVREVKNGLFPAAEHAFRKAEEKRAEGLYGRA